MPYFDIEMTSSAHWEPDNMKVKSCEEEITKISEFNFIKDALPFIEYSL